MTDHFACIGIDTGAAADVADVVTPLMARAAETIYRGGGSLFDWRDPSGAGITVTTVTVDNVVQCVAPTFTAGRRLAAIATGFGGESHCRFCNPLVVDVIDEDGRVLHALSVRLEDAATTRRRILIGQPVTLAVTGFAERHNVWPEVAAYERSQQPRRHSAVPLGTVAPTGLYATEPSPHAMVTGVVTATEQRTNETTDLPFRWAVVSTDGGEIELVMPPRELEAGHVVQALCWMVGRVVDGLGAEPRGLAALRRR